MTAIALAPRTEFATIENIKRLFSWRSFIDRYLKADRTLAYMTDGYGSHADYMARVEQKAIERAEKVGATLRQVFGGVIKEEPLDVIDFVKLNPLDLATAILEAPIILKPLLAICNIAERALERDVQIKIRSYEPRLSQDQAKVVAGYIKPFLPEKLALDAIKQVDRVAFVDKEVRAAKGRWEKEVILALNKLASTEFKKRKFICEGDEFELDGASPQRGEIKFGVDIKRIEARRDIHKRCDEIVNKADKFKHVFPSGRFGVVVYYPFEQINVRDRLRSDNIDSIVFASESVDSIEDAIALLVSKLGA